MITQPFLNQETPPEEETPENPPEEETPEMPEVPPQD